MSLVIAPRLIRHSVNSSRGLQFEFLVAQVGHAADDVLAFPHVGAFVRSNEVGHVGQHRVVFVACPVDEAVDRLEHADFAEQVDLGHGVRGFHGAAAGGAGQAVGKFVRVVA